MGTSKNRLAEAVQTSSHNLCFERKCEKYPFLSENLHFLVVKFSVYLNRRVFLTLESPQTRFAITQNEFMMRFTTSWSNYR